MEQPHAELQQGPRPVLNGFKPRIAMLAAGDVFGGAERQLLTLCRAGSPYFETVIFQCLPGPLFEEAERVGIAVRMDLRQNQTSGQDFTQIFRVGRFDLLHAHGYLGSVIAASVRALGVRLPFVRTVHGAAERSFFSKMALYGRLGDLAAYYCKGDSVYVSHELRKRMKAQGPKAHVIHNGVEFAEKTPARPAEYSASAFNFLIVGRLEPVKNVGAALEAFAHGAFVRPAHLHIVGEGPERAALEAKAQALGIAPCVHFHGFRHDALSFISHADALLIPSLHEGIPYVLLEALWAATPVIASNVGGIPEVVTDRKEALLVPSRAPMLLAAAMAELMADEALRGSLSAQGKLRVQEEFTAARMAEDYARLYQARLAD